MDRVNQLFDLRGVPQAPSKIVSSLYLQIMFLAIGAFNLAIFICLFSRDVRRGNPSGLVTFFAVDMAGFALMILLASIGIRRSIHRLLDASNLSDQRETP